MTNSPLHSTTALLTHIAQGHPVEYVFFWGHRKAKQGVNHSCFSQWYEAPFQVAGNLAKFGQHHSLRQYLLGTGDKVLVEASPVDCIWGIGLSKDDRCARQPEHWNGLNLLGFALMRVREQLTT